MVDITFSFLWTSWACPLSGSCPALSPASLSAWRWACPDPVSAALCPAWWLRWSCPPNDRYLRPALGGGGNVFRLHLVGGFALCAGLYMTVELNALAVL